MFQDHTLHIKGVCCNKPLNKVQLDHNEREYYLLIMFSINAILSQTSYYNIFIIWCDKVHSTKYLKILFSGQLFITSGMGLWRM